MRAACVLVLLAAVPSCLHAFQQGQAESMSHKGNPIRKVVTMLQSMTKKVEAEGEKEQELYHKFMCYCKTGTGDLEKSISEAETKVPQLESSIKEGVSQKTQMDGDIVSHKADRSAAKGAIAEATAIREKEAKEHAQEAAEASANMASTAKAVKALTGGMTGSFLQTSGLATAVLRAVQQRQNMDESEREFVTSFFTDSQEDASTLPSSGEIVGILQTMHEDMAKDLAEAAAAEKANIASFDELISAKTKEVNACGKAIEEKISRTGELAVEIVQQKDDLSDTSDQLEEDRKFVVTLNSNCGTKTADFEKAQKTRGEELVALADTVKILNDDDALDLFKKTLPSGSASFVQVEESNNDVRKRALAFVHHRPSLDFIALAMHGKTAGFETIVRMVDEMAAFLKKEQVDDDSKKTYCGKQFDKADDKKRGLQRSISDVETVIANSQDDIATLQEEIKTLGASIAALDQSTTQATEQRKEENAEFTSSMTGNSGAKEILNFAKSRLNKFYRAAGASLAQVSAHVQAKRDMKQSDDSNGVIAMIDLLINDIEKQMTVSKFEEKDSQGDYEQMVQDSQDKRAGDMKSLAGKQKILADLKASLEASNESKTSSTKELGAQVAYIVSLHSECDWLLQNFDTRKEARASEIDALSKAKAVLNGADYSLMQVKSRTFLSRA